MYKILIVLLALLNFCLADYEARVVKIIDGDTVQVLSASKEKIKIRLYGIDAPEKKQAYGKVSRNALADKIAGNIVKVSPNGKDRYERELAKIYLGNEDINRYMVRNGFAWAFIKYSKEYAGDEIYARNNKLVLWLSINPTPQWIFRKIYILSDRVIRK